MTFVMYKKLFFIFFIFSSIVMSTGCNNTLSKQLDFLLGKKPTTFPEKCERYGRSGSDAFNRCAFNMTQNGSDMNAEYYVSLAFKKERHPFYRRQENKHLVRAANLGHPKAVKELAHKKLMRKMMVEESRVAKQKRAARDAEKKRLAVIAKKERKVALKIEMDAKAALAVAEMQRYEKLSKEKAAAQLKKETKNATKACYPMKDSKVSFSGCLYLARQGESLAQLSIAEMYRKGFGVNQDLDKALFWAKKLESNGNPRGKALVADIKPLIKLRDLERAKKEKLRLANIWYSIYASDWYSENENTVSNSNSNYVCKKSESPAEKMKGSAFLTPDAKFVDEEEANGKVSAVTIVYTNPFRIARGAKIATRYIRGKHHCDGYAAKYKKIAQANLVAHERKLDKYR